MCLGRGGGWNVSVCITQMFSFRYHACTVSFPVSLFGISLSSLFFFRFAAPKRAASSQRFPKGSICRGGRSTARRSLSSTNVGKNRQGGSSKVRKKRREKGQKTAPDESDKYCVSFPV